MRTTRQWLEDLGLGQYAEAFEAEQVELGDLADLTEDDLKDLGLPLGPRKRLLKSAAEFDPDAEPAARPAAATPEAERRQLTVMFCDLVGSTALSEKLDPEDLRGVMDAYRKAAGDVVGRYQGHVAQYLGDGVMVYFGWPSAHEDDAGRAVRAGLEIVEAVQELDTSAELAVRVGIATGLVVVGAGADRSDARLAVGETPNIAARVQGLADRNTVAIARSTRRLLGGTFELEDLGAHEVKGVTGHLQVHRVIGEASAVSRFDAAAGGHLTPFVGRDSETALLLERWDQARDGEGQVVLLSGEPGIGKSRVTQVLRERLADEPHTRLRYQCSPYANNSALHPVIEQIARAAGFARGDSMDARLDKLEALLQGGAESSRPPATPPPQPSPARGEGEVAAAKAEAAADTNDKEPPPPSRRRVGVGVATQRIVGVPAQKVEGVPLQKNEQTLALFAAMLSLDITRYPPLNMSPQKQKDKTLKALADQVAALAARQPVLMIFEDAHWIDPTTQEVLDQIVPRVADLAVLLVITYRPEYTPPWTGLGHVAPVTLTRLGRAQAATMVARVTGGKSLPDEVLDQIVAKTDGVPLFVEELTKTVIESGIAKTGDEDYTLTGQLTDLAIPSTLQDSLMARLDRLSPVKGVAQIGACIGRVFAHDLLAAISPLGANELEDALQQLVNSELIFRTGAPPNTTYTFKHALVQDTAYGSLLKSRRQQIHGNIARTLETSFSEIRNTEPELLGHHFSSSGIVESAVSYFIEAGKQALRGMALKEAVSHLNDGLRLVGEIGDETERDRLDLDVRAVLGTTYMALLGWPAPEVESTLGRALTLCRKVEKSEHVFSVLWGLWCYHSTRSNFDDSLMLVEEMISVARPIGDTDMEITGLMAACLTCFWMGDFARAAEYRDRLLDDYDIGQHGHLVTLTNHDPKTTVLVWGTQLQWMLGYPDQAKATGEDMLALAGRLKHPFNTCFALTAGAGIYDMCREPAELLRRTDEAIQIAIEHSMPLVEHVIGPIWGAPALIHSGEFDRCVADAESAIASWSALGGNLITPFWMTTLANALRRCGRVGDALATIDQAQELAETTGHRVYLADVYRMKGEILAHAGAEHGDPEHYFLKAIELAPSQQAKSWELRAATSLARLWQSQGKLKEAHDLLAPAYEWFTEGFDTADLIDAKALLDELS